MTFMKDNFGIYKNAYGKNYFFKKKMNVIKSAQIIFSSADTLTLI